MNDLHQLSGAYAMDALDDLERQRFEQHLATCESCRVEVDSFRATLAEVAATEEEAPPPSLRQAVLEQVDGTRQVAPRTRRVGRRLDTTRVLRVAAGFLTVAVVGLSVLSAQLSVRVGELQRVAAPVVEVLRAPDTVTLTESGTAEGGVVRVLAAPASGEAVLVVDGLAPVDADRAYQLWLIDADGAPTSAGLLELDATGGTDRVVRGELDTVVALAVSVEPAGGSPAPTTDPVAVVEL